ncbi:MAG: glycine cleavage system aminomethyltransferase GcvT [Treponema sp.]|nr:glycine cleavage system aminomethyltransferase GcvT [Treponema sp.]
MEKRTPLFEWHSSNGGRMVSFAGYSLPVQYETGVIAEHNAVRKNAGLFDVSHMAEFTLTGKDALRNLGLIFTNDFTNMVTGRVRYTLLCNETGGIIDDLVVCKMDEGRYMLVVNAANREKDAAWIGKKISGDCCFEDVSDDWAQIALQGPQSQKILASVSNTIPSKYYTLIENGSAAGIPCIISQTGYTGEDGFELYCKNNDAVLLWEKLLDAGKNAGLLPCGLGCRDTLRLEAGMPLWGHEMDETITPFEAGLSFGVKMNKPDFIGKTALEKKFRPSRLRTGIEITGRGIAREKSAVYSGGVQIGITTSGTFCPYLEKACAMALLDAGFAKPGIAVNIDVRGRMIEGVTCTLPFYKKIIS